MEGLRVLALAALVLVALAAGVHRFGTRRWRQATEALGGRLAAARTVPTPGVVNLEQELATLPLPVQRYFRRVLNDGQPFVTSAYLEHKGRFNMGETAQQWKPFRSRQWTSTRRPGFIWDGEISFAPGVAVRVHDAYIAGEGILHAALLGLLSVAELCGTPEVARGELMRYLAEAPLVPTALLPSQGVRWAAVNEASADATLTDGGLSLTLRFSFDAQGLVDTVGTANRGRMVGGRIVETAWQGRWRGYERRGGMLVPTEGEVAWLLPDGAQPYWRGRLQRIDYEFAPSAG